MSDFTVLNESETLPLYAEIERLKRERDALAEALRDAKTSHANLYAQVFPNTPPESDMVYRNICAILAQVRK